MFAIIFSGQGLRGDVVPQVRKRVLERCRASGRNHFRRSGNSLSFRTAAQPLGPRTRSKVLTSGWPSRAVLLAGQSNMPAPVIRRPAQAIDRLQSKAC
jgi:hypothetical protein